MEVKPVRIVPSSDDNTEEGSGPQRKIDRGWTIESVKERMVVVKEEVELGLGVGDHTATAISPVIFTRKRCLLTEAQWRELQHQIFIFRHFASGLPVPLNFVLSILRSVADAFRPDLGEFYKLFPSFLGFDYRGMVDPEPNRCRRTDGKTWRCSKNTVTDQKYCERHMHRVCKRSRKHVETSQVTSSLITKPSGNLHAKLGWNTESMLPNPSGIQFGTAYSGTPSHSLCCTDNIWPADRCENNIVSTNTRNSPSPTTAAVRSSMPATAVIARAKSVSSLASVNSRNNNNLNIDKEVDDARTFISNNSSSIRSNGKGNIIVDGKNISTGLDFSPRSVFQGIVVPGCNNSTLNYGNSMVHEPGRCRRTDGKKWRCRKAALPRQKYCATHMHRGAKKRFSDQEPATVPLSSSDATAVAGLPLATTVPCFTSMLQVQDNEKSSISTSDTDTTISDNMIE